MRLLARGSFFLTIALATSATSNAQICTPNGVIQGSTTLASGKVIVGTTACAEVTNSQGSRFQVLGNSGASNPLNYAATVLMPALTTIPLPGQIFGFVGRSGTTGTASGTGSTAGLFEAWGGDDNTSGIVANATLNHSTATSAPNVYGMKAEASTNQGITGGERIWCIRFRFIFNGGQL